MRDSWAQAPHLRPASASPHLRYAPSVRYKTRMQGIASLVPKLLPQDIPIDRGVLGIFSQWCRSVPERVVNHAQPVRMRGGVLTLHTTTAAWANLLQLESENLLAGLRARYPQCGVRRLVFRQGPFPKLPLPPKEPPAPVIVPLAQVPEAVAVQLVRIRSEELRDAVARAVAVGLGHPEKPNKSGSAPKS